MRFGATEMRSTRKRCHACSVMYNTAQWIMQEDLCITSPFAQFLRQAQIIILEISNIFLWLKFSPSLKLNKIEHSAKVSKGSEK